MNTTLCPKVEKIAFNLLEKCQTLPVGLRDLTPRRAPYYKGIESCITCKHFFLFPLYLPQVFSSTFLTAVPTTPLNVSTSLTSGTSSAVSSRANISDTGSMETVIAARPVLEEEVLRVVPETILEAKPVVEECVHNLSDTYAASQVLLKRKCRKAKWH